MSEHGDQHDDQHGNQHDDSGPGELHRLLDWLEASGSADPEALQALRTHPALATAEPTAAARAAQLLCEQGYPQDLDTAAQLAWAAHEAGVAGAGRTFASAIDRAAVLRSRIQKFGTFAFEHRGELLPAPLDGSVTDELRAELGVPALAELHAELDRANRASAAARAEQPELDAGQTYARVWRDPQEATLRDRMQAEGQPIWADGDELTVVCDRPLIGAIVGPLFELPMWRVGELLVLTVRVARLDEAVFTYGFWPLDDDGRPAFTSRPDPDGRFRGPKARPAAPTNETLRGRTIEQRVPSPSLGGERTVTVYLPPGVEPGPAGSAEPLPVVYATDGQFLAPYTRRLDAAIEAGTTPPCVVVASHAGRNRTGEYFPQYDPPAFARHERFFVDELANWAEANLPVATDPAQRAVFGTSDGGAHALTIGLLHRARFGHLIAYSSGLPPTGTERWDGAPSIQLCAGAYEGQFHTATYAWHALLSMSGVEHHWTERVCGHELLQWIEELPDALARAFAS